MSISTTAQTGILAMSGLQFLDHINSRENTKYDKLTVEAAVVRQPPTGTGEPKILLLQRNLDGAYYPGVFEMPGEKVDETDRCISDALAREVMEETNLTVSQILNALPRMTYPTEKNVLDAEGAEKVVNRKAIQISYVVEVQDEEAFRWNPNEHCAGKWFKESMLEDLDITQDMKSLVSKAIAMRSIEES